MKSAWVRCKISLLCKWSAIQLHYIGACLCIPGEYVAVYSPGGASGNSGNRHGSGNFHTDGGNRHIQPGCGTDFGHKVQVGIIQCYYFNELWDLQTLLIEFDFSCFLLFLSSETRIPLWRWQRMMIFMLANTICCIVTSVLLNIADYRRVRQTLPALLCICSANVCWRLPLFAGRNPEQDQEKVRAGADRLGQRATQGGRGGAAQRGWWRV